MLPYPEGFILAWVLTAEIKVSTWSGKVDTSSPEFFIKI
jgi:hypothetical protein